MVCTLLARCFFVAMCSASTLAQQELPPSSAAQLAVPGAAPLTYRVQLPAGFHDQAWCALAVLLGDGADADAAAAALATQGFVVAQAKAAPGVPALLAALRQQFRIAGGGIHLVALEADVAPAAQLIAGHGWQLQSATLLGGEVGVELGPWSRVAGRTAVWFIDAAPGAGDPVGLLRRPAVASGRLAAVVAEHVSSLHAQRSPKGAAGEVHRVLDAFHDAASTGDEDRYFAILPEDAVFLGTDATERWSGAEFRAFALPYFQRGPAWIYVPVSRHVTVATSGGLAWFDEVLDNASYGECRGSGVLERRGERWVVRQYNLVIPVPNDLARGLVDRVRALARGTVPAVTTVVVVRHGEKGEGRDPDLNEVGKASSERLQQALAHMPVSAIYASEYRRTQATVAPTAQAKGLQTRVHKAGDTKGLAARILADHLGETVLVAGHSNTVGPLLRALGVTDPVELTEADFGDVFVVVLSVDGAKLLRLR